MPLILGVETSCDDTSLAVVRDWQVLSLVTQTQLAQHRRFGGVVPEIASRRHIATIAAVFQAALEEARVSVDALDAVAVTYGPGLAGSLLVGLNFAKGISTALGKPLLGVNHLEAHVYASWIGLEPARQPPLPAVCLVVSGGHSEITLMRAHADHILLGRTRDDAAGEAFDKVARVLGLGFPGGPAIEAAAGALNGRGGPPYRLPRPWLEGTYDFSFSGLKTAVYRARAGKLGPAEQRRIFGDEDPTPFREGDPQALARMAAGFQEAIVEVLAAKTAAAVAEFDPKSVVLAGGVAANRLLRERIMASVDRPLFMPAIPHCTDNGAMVALAGAFLLDRGEFAADDLDVRPTLRLAKDPVTR